MTKRQTESAEDRSPTNWLMIAIFVATIALLAVVLAIGVEFHRSSLINARNEGRLEVLQTLHEYANPAVPTSIPVVEPTPVPQPIATTIVNQVKEKLGIAIKADGNLALEGKLFQTPVKCTDSFNQGSSWLICEPGVILDNTAAWTIPGTKEPWYINVPEGGFTFFSMGEGAIAIDGVSLDLPGEEGLNYLVVIRGRIDDTIVDRDLNLTAKVTDFVPGHAIWSIMPPGAYVSKDWFRDQLVVSTTTGGTNCGATGCTRTRIVLFDVDSHTYQMFETHRGDIDNWTLLAAN